MTRKKNTKKHKKNTHTHQYYDLYSSARLRCRILESETSKGSPFLIYRVHFHSCVCVCVCVYLKKKRNAKRKPANPAQPDDDDDDDAASSPTKKKTNKTKEKRRCRSGPQWNHRTQICIISKFTNRSIKNRCPLHLPRYSFRVPVSTRRHRKKTTPQVPPAAETKKNSVNKTNPKPSTAVQIQRDRPRKTKKKRSRARHRKR